VVEGIYADSRFDSNGPDFMHALECHPDAISVRSDQSQSGSFLSRRFRQSEGFVVDNEDQACTDDNRRTVDLVAVVSVAELQEVC